MQVIPEEAYLLGCLFGRGSIGVTKSKTYKLVFRIPFRECSPIMLDIVNTLIRSRKGKTYKDLLQLPKVRANNVIDLRGLLRRLKYWHPPGKTNYKKMLVRKNSKWEIGNRKLSKEFIRWQDLYLQREIVGVQDYVLKHLSKATVFLGTSPMYREEISAFGIINHIIECEITPHSFGVLKAKYGVEEGDVYRHARISRTLFKSGTEALQEFVRGLADTIATIDLWLDIPRVQFSVINENWQLPTEICRILQKNLKIPVFYVEWAGDYMDRGGRDHLVKVWVVNFDEKRFPTPLYYNKRKQEEFIEHLEKSKKRVGSRRTSMFGFCPLGRRKIKYMRTCIKQGCKQVTRSKKILGFT